MNDLYNNAIGHWVVVVVAMALLLFVVLGFSGAKRFRINSLSVAAATSR